MIHFVKIVQESPLEKEEEEKEKVRKAALLTSCLFPNFSSDREKMHFFAPLFLFHSLVPVSCLREFARHVTSIGSNQQTSLSVSQTNVFKLEFCCIKSLKMLGEMGDFPSFSAPPLLAFRPLARLRKNVWEKERRSELCAAAFWPAPAKISPPPSIF